MLNKSDFIFSSLSGTDITDLYIRLKACKGFAAAINPENVPDVQYNTVSSSYTTKEGPIYITNEGVDKMDLSIGITIHESGHKKWSNELFGALEVLINNGSSTHRLIDMLFDSERASELKSLPNYTNTVYKPILKDLINFLEDRRIDFRLWKENPGWREYYLNLYNHYFWLPKLKSALQSKVTTKPVEEDYLFRIININNKWSNLDALPGLREILNIIDLNNIIKDSTQDILAKAFKIYFKIQEYITKPNTSTPSQSVPKLGDGNLGEGDGQSGQVDDGMQPEDQKDSNVTLDDIDKILTKQREFVSGKYEIKQVKYDIKNSVEALVKQNAKIDKTKLTTNGSVVVINIDDATKDSDALAPTQRGRDKIIAKGFANGKKLAANLAILNDKRISESVRKKSGGLVSRLLAESPYNTNVFSHKTIEEAQSSFIYLTIDISGSISSGMLNKMVEFMAMTGKCFAELGNVHYKMVARYTSGDNIYNYTLYNSTRNSLKLLANNLNRLKTLGGTPESLAFDSSLDDIIKSANGKSAYFISMSDGEPGGLYTTKTGESYNLSADYAKHIKDCIKKLESAGITVANYFLGSGDESEIRKYYKEYADAWGKSFHAIDFNNINQISKNLNNLMVESKVKF